MTTSFDYDSEIREFSEFKKSTIEAIVIELNGLKSKFKIKEKDCSFEQIFDPITRSLRDKSDTELGDAYRKISREAYTIADKIIGASVSNKLHLFDTRDQIIQNITNSAIEVYFRKNITKDSREQEFSQAKSQPELTSEQIRDIIKSKQKGVSFQKDNTDQLATEHKQPERQKLSIENLQKTPNADKDKSGDFGRGL